MVSLPLRLAAGEARGREDDMQGFMSRRLHV
jgi:hypothetical protein